MRSLLKKVIISVILSGLAMPLPATADERKDIAVDVLTKGMIGGDKLLIESHVAKTLVTHSTKARDGRAGLIAYVDKLQALKPKLAIKPVRVLRDGNMVVVHSEYIINSAQIGFDIFRFEKGKIVEHWQALQAKPKKTVSGRSMTDGPTTIVDQEKTNENRTLVAAYVGDVLGKGNDQNIDKYVGDVYHQHNPDIADGKESLVKVLIRLRKQGGFYSYSKTHHVIAEGNFVFTLSQGDIWKFTHGFFDLFRVEGGKVVEHWDVIQRVPWWMPHNNGMF